MNYRPIIIAAAQATGLYIAGFIIPVLGQVFVLLTPVPLILAYLQNDRAHGVSALALSVMAVWAIAGWLTAAILLFSFGIMAIGIAEGILRRWKPESVALFGGLLPVVAAAAVAFYYFGVSAKDPVMAVEEYLRANIDEAGKLYAKMGFTEMMEAVKSVSDSFIYYLVRLIPGIMISTSVLQAGCCYALARTITLKKQGAAGSSYGFGETSFASWHAPDVWVWGLIAALVLAMVPYGPARFAGINASILYAVVYLVQGMAIVEHYFRKAQIKPVLRSLLHALILALPAVVFVIALGLVDIWADVRKVRHTENAPDIRAR